MTSEAKLARAFGINPDQLERGSLTIAPFGYNTNGERSFIVRANTFLIVTKDQVAAALEDGDE